MSLHNTESSNGYIEATDRDGYAISNPIIQDTGSNISTSSSTADTLVSDTEIVDGDILVIQLDDGSYNEFIVTSITGSGPWTVDTSSVTNGEVPDIVYKKETFESSFTSIKNISAKYEHINIADGSGIDVLRTTEEIRDGDKLVIVLNDNSINEMAASSVTKSVKPTYVGLDSGYPEENICALTIDGLNTYTTKFISCSGITSFFISDIALYNSSSVVNIFSISVDVLASCNDNVFTSIKGLGKRFKFPFIVANALDAVTNFFKMFKLLFTSI